MAVWVRLLIAAFVTAATSIASFIAIFYLFARFGSCPPEVRTCDLPMYAGFFLGMILGPIIGLVVGALIFRRPRRGRTASAIDT